MNIAMEKTIRKWLFLSAALFSGWWGNAASTASAQNYNLQIRLQNGTVKTVPTNEIASIEFKEDLPPELDGLTGRWMLIASPVGVAGDDGIYTSKADTIQFTAAMGSEPGTLQCHAESFVTRSGITYSADWLVQVSQNEQDGTRRLGWQLSEQTPVCTQSDRHLYLLSENIQTQRLEGMTLWSEWQPADATTFTFPQNQEIYGVLSPTIPYSSPGSEYLEIWASPRFVIRR